MGEQMVEQTEELSPYWRRNLVISAFGAFTTIVGMTVLLPFLPLFVEEIGVSDTKAISEWSGIAYAATFFSAALVAPLWGRLGDRYGRKLMLVRASFGMAISIGLMGFVTSISQLVLLRLLTGLAGGYASGAAILAATQTPKDKTGWALGVISSGVMAGNFIGPLIGGILPNYIGIRTCFVAIGILIFITFIVTTFAISENHKVFVDRRRKKDKGMLTRSLFNHSVCAMLLTGALLTFANLSIEPIITIYVNTLSRGGASVTFWAGLVMSMTALGSALSASLVGRLADRVGHWKILVGAMILSTILVLPQAFVETAWMLVVLRFLLGLALGGLIPCVTAILRHIVPDYAVGTVLGLSVSSQYVGQVLGPVCGGFIGGWFGVRPVFFVTALVIFVAVVINLKLYRHYEGN